jgi:DNA invertase Pin-like site-specific DNA recombinase
MIIIYLRTSTGEQNPENQKNDCLILAKLIKEEFEIFEEKQSAFKDDDREIFESIKRRIKNKEITHLIVWDLDRLFRNRKKLIEFFEYCKIYKCKIHSFRQQWLEQLNNIPEPFNEIMHGLMLQIMGWLAEEESQKKSERVKNAIRIKDGITKSYKGNKWGFHSVGRKTDNQIIELYKQGKTMKEITKEIFYWNKNKNKKYVSIGYVHKVIHKLSNEVKEENNGKNDIQEVNEL